MRPVRNHYQEYVNYEKNLPWSDDVSRNARLNLLSTEFFIRHHPDFPVIAEVMKGIGVDLEAVIFFDIQPADQASEYSAMCRDGSGFSFTWNGESVSEFGWYNFSRDDPHTMEAVQKLLDMRGQGLSE